ncbi:MAG: tRNA (adenosine(37)-N6)-threonylcarbamoyltransferase complex dimerization subunit type 1 TsaB [Clostridia bacterium]|nr:tRNA (adenosine(37)-N6)-threonylcarbamoyltransferase complex dimerization subunit type 1 TsaB [Clostridia bacterium]
MRTMLGISTSSRCPSAAVMRGGEILSFQKDESGASHSAVLMELIENALKEAGVERSGLDGVAVDIGPGSFTGVRIGVSCANAMAYALGISVYPVSSLAALRCLAPDEGVTAALIDCRNGNCYAAVFIEGKVLSGPAPAVTEEVISALPAGARTVGNCLGENMFPDAELVLKEVLRGIVQPVPEAVPMYLRPSQAERMKQN